MEKLQDKAENQRKQQQSTKQRKEEEACHQSFGPVDYRDHKNQNPSRVPGTCSWFLNNQYFIDWNQQKNSALLWVSADPGCGKSVLIKSVVDERLLGDTTSLSSVCYFFKDGFVGQQGLARCISALLHQLFSQKAHLIEYALPDFRRDWRVAENFSAVWDILLQAAFDPEAGEIICVLDALDECEDKNQENLIRTLKELYLNHKRCRGMKLKFLVSSRPYPIIERRFRTLTKDFPSIHLKGEHESDLISEEINLVIRKRVPEIAVELELSSQAEQRLLDGLLGVPNRTYLWLHLIFEAILKSTGVTSVKAIEKIISQLPESVDDAYDKILARATDFNLCRRLLHIILTAQEPLTLTQMNLALHIDDHTLAIADLDLEDDEHFEKTVRGLCGLFVSVVSCKLFLIHQTAREYLKGHPENISVWKHSFDQMASDTILARCCILYLRCSEFEMNHPVRKSDADSEHLDRHYGYDDKDNEPPEPPLAFEVQTLNEHNQFFQYAATKWASHFEDSDIDELEGLAMDLCDPSSRHFLA